MKSKGIKYTEFDLFMGRTEKKDNLRTKESNYDANYRPDCIDLLNLKANRTQILTEP